MTKRQKTEEVVEKFEVKQSDIDRYIQFCKENPQYKVGGTYVSPRERYLIANGWAVFKDGEVKCVDPKMWMCVDQLEFERNKTIPKHKPSKEFWDSIKPSLNRIEGRILPANYGDYELL